MGIALQALAPAPFSPVAYLVLTLCCALAGLVVLLRSRIFPSGIATAVYWGASICAGLVIGSEAREPFNVNPEHQQSCAAQTEMRAVIKGDVLHVLRRDSTKTAHILRVIVQGTLDAEPLPRLAEQRVILTLIFPATSLEFKSASQTLSLLPTQIHAGSRIYACVRLRLPHEALLPTDIDEQQYAASLGAAWMAVANISPEASNGALVGENATLQTSVEHIQEWLEQRMSTLFPAETAPFALALLTGNTQYLSADTKREYARAGTAHVLAVSGLHLAVIAGMLLVPLGFIRQRWLRFWAFAFGIAAFVLVTGAAASALRSGVMAVLVFWVITMEREAVLLNVLAFSVVVMLLWQPNILFAVGFQMSVAAIVGITLMMPLCEHFVAVWSAGRPEFSCAIKSSSYLPDAFGFVCCCTDCCLVFWYIFGDFTTCESRYCAAQFYRYGICNGKRWRILVLVGWSGVIRPDSAPMLVLDERDQSPCSLVRPKCD
jgi:ComEC/Rec2-related protein